MAVGAPASTAVRLLARLLPLLLVAAAAGRAQPAPGAEPDAAGLAECRFAPGVVHQSCGLPLTASNFQGNYACDAGVRVGRPASVEQAAALVGLFPRVKAAGVGHSWFRESFCPGAGGDALALVTTELAPTLAFIKSPSAPERWLAEAMPPDFPIRVDEERAAVTVAAGVPQRMLLDYLAAYVHGANPDGWTLPAYSWFIDQTIGGAVATGTHGSSLSFGSLSSQLRSLRLIVANGTVVTLDPAATPHLWRAAGVSVGRLGVIVEVTLRIVRQRPVTRTVRALPFSAFADEVAAVAGAYAAAARAGDAAAAAAALARLDETGAFWFVPSARVLRADFAHADKDPAAPRAMVTAAEGPPAGDGGADGLPAGAYAQPAPPRPPVEPSLLQAAPGADAARAWDGFYYDRAAAAAGAQNGTFPRRAAFLQATEAEAVAIDTLAPYDQCEVSVPLELAGACLREVGAEIYGPAALWEGFRTQAQVRFVAGEEFYLSNSHDGPRMFVNLEDYVAPSAGGDNARFDAVVGLFLSRCRGRLHWGKAGFPKHKACFDGAAEYPGSWCDFGCAARELDPAGKFRSEADGWVWRWAAERGGAPVPDFGACCGPDGFDAAACTCARSPSPRCPAGDAAAKAGP